MGEILILLFGLLLGGLPTLYLIYEAIATTKRKEQERLKELYSYDKLFKKTNIKESNSKDIVAVKQEKSFFKKIINKIKSFF